MIYTDLLGLTNLYIPNTERANYAAEIGCEGTYLNTQSERLSVLSRLVEGAGVTILTGPSGAPFWMLASIENKIKVVPDGYEFNERTSDVMTWALRAVGLSDAESKALSKTSPTPRHRLYNEWVQASSLADELRMAQAAGHAPLIDAAFSAEIIYEPADQLNLLDNISDHELVALDWEWNHRVQGNPPLGLNVSVQEKNWYLPTEAADYPNRGYGPQLKENFSRLVERGKVVMHNGKTDLQTQYQENPLWLSGKPIDDTLLMAYIAGYKVLDLKEMTREVLNRDPMERPDDLPSLPVATMARYGAAGDTRNTFDLYHALRKTLEATNQLGVYETIERPVSPIIASMELYGTPVDGEELEQLRTGLLADEQRYRDKFIASDGLDIGEDDDTHELIRRRIGYKLGNLRKEVLASLQQPWAAEVIKYRQARHRRRSFVDKHLGRWYAAGKPQDFRAYSHFNQAGEPLRGDGRTFRRAPRTGRLSSSGDFGNLQNQPRTIRSAFVCPPDHVFWSLDYSGLELRLAAAISGDPEMLRVLTEVCPSPDALGVCHHQPKHGDLHDSFLYKIVALSGHNPGRPVAKNGNFEQLYGGGPDKLVNILALEESYIDYATAKLVVDTHKEAYAVYHSHGSNVIANARGNGGYSESLFGRRRYEADLFGLDTQQQSWAERALVNMTVQGSAADVLKMAMAYAVPILKYYDAHMSLQVHDEMCGWVPVEKASAFIRDMKRMMTSIKIPGIDLLVEGGVGPTWAVAH